MNNKARVVSEQSHEVYLLTPGTEQFKVFRHRIIERTVRMRPEMVIYEGRVYYDYTDIMRKAFETGQQAYIRR